MEVEITLTPGTTPEEVVTETEREEEAAPTAVSERRIDEEVEEEEEEETEAETDAERETEDEGPVDEVVAAELIVGDDITSVLVEVAIIEEPRLSEVVARTVVDVEVGVPMKVDVMTELVT